MEGHEIDYALSRLTVLVDTREQPTKRAEQRLAAIGFSYARKALSFGDYSAKIVGSDGTEISFETCFAIERKMNLDEICACFCHERKRFTNEFERAKTAGAKLYLLIENGDLEKAFNHKYRSKMQPQALTASLFAWLARYDCQLIFCKEETSGKVIREIIVREVKERLTAMEETRCADG